MKLQTIFTQLSINEFSKLSIGGEDQGVVNENNYKNIIPQIQLGLTALYTRFNLKEGRLKLQLLENRESYPLTSVHSAQYKRNKGEAVFILDSPSAPFRDDILKIKAVTNSRGWEYPINDSTDKYSLGSLTNTSLYVPRVIFDGSSDLPEYIAARQLDVTYWANHPEIKMTVGYFDPERVDIELPDAYMEPLLYYIASRVHNPVGMVNEFNAGNNYAAKYEQSCMRLEERNLDQDEWLAPTRFRRNGWV